MYPIYVQNVSRWIKHYDPDTAPDTSVPPPSDSVFSTDNAGIAHEGHMNVSQVEAKGPPPPVPSVGVPAAFRTISSSQATVQQAVFDAKREEIEQSESKIGPQRKITSHSRGGGGGAGSQKRKAGNGAKKSNVKKKHLKQNDFGESALLGTPGDIFKSKTSSRGKKKKKN